MSSSSKDRLVSHPHQSLWRHLRSVDEVSGLALKSKILHPAFYGVLDLHSLRKLLVYFHDFGKATTFFQYRIAQAALRDNPSLDQLDANHVRHCTNDVDELIKQVAEHPGDPRRGHALIGAFAVQVALTTSISPLLRVILYEVIARHHSNLKNFSSEIQRGASDHAATLTDQWEQLYLTDFQAILHEVNLMGPESIEELHRYDTLFFERVYRGLRRNGTLLPYLQTVFLYSLLLSGDKGDLMLAEREVVGRVRRLPLGLIDAYKADKFEDAPTQQMNIWREEVYQRVIQELEGHPGEGFYAITLPTGMGKTLTAYNVAIRLQHLRQNALQKAVNAECTPRIIYCLPFTSVIDQNAGILEEILTVYGGVSGELAKHHYLADWPNQKADRDTALTYSDREYLVEGWEYTVTVTTFVQLLETVISNRNRKLRKFHNLANAIVILDEVQSIPPKYFDLVSKVFVGLHEWLDTRFVFVTATQPFLMNPNDGYDVLELTDPTREYTRRAFERMNRIDLDLTLYLDGPDDIQDQAKLFSEAVREENERSFLIILNLVRESQTVYHHLSEQALPNTEYIYLSSAVLPIERKRRIQQIKQPPEGIRTIVVSTQVVEAGVDVDLDVVYRAFAPLDSINQSAGRCNRNMHGGQRGSVRLVKSLKAETIYDTTLLTKTDKVLRKIVGQANSSSLAESSFYDLNELYAREVRRAVADGSDASKSILKHLYTLQFEEAEREFKLIKQEYVRYGVFVDDPNLLPKVAHQDEALTSTQVYNKMMDILKDDNLDRWTKKQQLRLLRPALLQYVVQFPEKYLPEDLREEAATKPFIRLHTHGGNHDYRRCYDLITGYFLPEERASQCF